MTRWHRLLTRNAICLHPTTKGNSTVRRARVSYDNKIGLFAVISLFSITHSRQSVLYHSQSSVCSLSLTVVSLFSITHSRQSVLYHSQSSVYSLSLTVVSLFSITPSRQSVLYHSQSSVCSLITHSRQSVLYHSQSPVSSASELICKIRMSYIP